MKPYINVHKSLARDIWPTEMQSFTSSQSPRKSSQASPQKRIQSVCNYESVILSKISRQSQGTYTQQSPIKTPKQEYYAPTKNF